MRTRLFVGSPYEGYVTDEVSSIPTELANLCQETREKFVTDLAAVSRGKDESKNPSIRFKALLNEAAPNSKSEVNKDFKGFSSRPMEFCPVVIYFEQVYFNGNIYYKVCDYGDNYNEFNLDGTIPEDDFINKILRYSYTETVDGLKSKIFRLYTNLRCLVNAGVSYDKIPFISTIAYKELRDVNDKPFTLIGGRKVYEYENLHVGSRHDSNSSYMLFKPSKLFENGFTYEEIVKDYKENKCNVDGNEYKLFKAIKLKIPMYIWAQWPMTHTALSKESQSDRVSEGNGYWLPEGIIEKINNTPDEEIMKINFSQEFIDLQASTSSSDIPAAAKIEYILNSFLNGYPQECVQQILKAAGYKREIWSRAPYYFKYKECVVTGWYNDPTTWQHSFLERSTEPEIWKNWTQKETKEVVQAVKEIVERK